MNSDLQIASPQVNVDIDRDKAAALGVTPQQIENALYDAFGERQASTIYADVAEYWVVFEVLPQFQLDPDALARLYITSSITSTNGTPNLVPLSAVANLTRSLGPTSISHVGQLPAVTISFNLAPGVSLGTAVEQFRKSKADLHLPATITGSFQGAAAGFSIVVTRDCLPCSSSPFWSFTSSSACFTKASSIRSRFCPACRRRALARCSR